MGKLDKSINFEDPADPGYILLVAENYLGLDVLFDEAEDEDGEPVEGTHRIWLVHTNDKDVTYTPEGYEYLVPTDFLFKGTCEQNEDRLDEIGARLVLEYLRNRIKSDNLKGGVR